MITTPSTPALYNITHPGHKAVIHVHGLPGSSNHIHVMGGRGCSEAHFILITVPSQLLQIKATAGSHSRVTGRTLLMLNSVPKGTTTQDATTSILL